MPQRTVIKSLLVLLTLLFLPGTLFGAHSNSITRAIELIEEFRIEADKGLSSVLPSALFKAYRAKSVEVKKEAGAKIDSLGWTDRPGTRRLKAVRTVVDDSITTLIRSITELKKELNERQGEELSKTVKELKALHKKIVAELDEAIKKVVVTNERRKPVPIIDSSPREKSPEAEGGGLWQR